MRKVFACLAAMAVLAGSQAMAQDDWGDWGDLLDDYESAYSMAMAGFSPLFYDPYIVLPGSAGGLGLNAGLETADIGSLGDYSDIWVMGKYGVTDQIEVGARMTTNLLNDARSDFADIVVGGKYGLTPTSAVTANATIINEASELGLSAGYMRMMQLGKVEMNTMAQVGLLDGYAGEGVRIDLRAEPKLAINDQVTGYLDVLLSTNTEDLFGDYMGLNIWPNVDYVVNDDLLINAGLTAGIAGDAKQEDLGLRVAAIYLMPLK